MASPRICLRIPERLRRLINARRGSTTLSSWLRDAASHRVTTESGLGRELITSLAEYNKQVRGLGINLNQLAHAANEGRPVAVNRHCSSTSRVCFARPAPCWLRLSRNCRSDQAGQGMSSSANSVFDDAWFVLARTGRARAHWCSP